MGLGAAIGCSACMGEQCVSRMVEEIKANAVGAGIPQSPHESQHPTSRERDRERESISAVKSEFCISVSRRGVIHRPRARHRTMGKTFSRPSPAFGVCGIFCACRHPGSSRHPAVNIEQWDIQHSTSPDVRRELDLRQDRRGQLSNRHHSDMDATRVTSDS